MIDLSTNREDIEKSLREIRSGNISWIWLGYKSESETIEVVSSGQSLKDMNKNIDPRRIMYGYARVTEENANMAKFVYILWLGNSSLKGKTIQFIKNGEDVSKLCRPIHLHVSARDDNELDWSEIKSRVLGNISIPTPNPRFMASDEGDNVQTDKLALIKQQRQAEINALIAARLVKQYARIEQQVGAKYEKPDFKSEIEAARGTKEWEQQETTATVDQKSTPSEETRTARGSTSKKESKTDRRHGQVSHGSATCSSKTKSKDVAVIALTCSTNVKKASTTNEVKVSTTSTQLDDELSEQKSLQDKAAGDTEPVDVAGRYDFTGICLFEFKGALDDEITIRPGDQITHIHQFDDRWLWGTNPKGKSGRFPKSYVELFETEAKSL